MNGAFLKQGTYTILDGGLGTLVQAAGIPGLNSQTVALTNPELLVRIHRAYIDAGAQIITASTFTANHAKLDPLGVSLKDAIGAAVSAAKQAAAGTGAAVALDVGPLGTLMEPNGSMRFEQAYAQYREIVTIGAACGADLVYLETMTDLGEIRAALLAAKENTGLPVFASMSFERDSRTFTGCDVRAAALTLSALGADAVGINCSLGPAEIFPIAKEMCAYTDLPVLIKPNAGLPDPATGGYSIDAPEFLRQMQPFDTLGIAGVGGCCGTTPDFIALLSGHFKQKTPPARPAAASGLFCSPTQVVAADRPRVVGERINPTGKPALEQALRGGRMDELQSLAVAQTQAGAALLDINVGVPGTDEAALMASAVRAVQSVSPLPLVIDSTRPAALKAGLRVCCGRALVNSVSAKAESLDTVLPLCAKYGAAVIGLCVDEAGVPQTAQDRLALAQKIVARTDAAGIRRGDVYIDCLAMTASVAQDAAAETLRAISLVKERLGVRTVLGVSNISYGLPGRDTLDAAFLTLALSHGLDLAILNPQRKAVLDAFDAYAVLAGYDRGAAAYIAGRGGQTAGSKPAQAAALTLREAVVSGLEGEARALTLAQLQTVDGMSVINGQIVPALDEVGALYESGEFFLPQLLQASNAAQAAFAAIRESLPAGEAAAQAKPVVIATVKGDVHDIGKNIAGSLLQNYGYTVIDLGKDVDAQTVVDAVRSADARLVGLSALMTTTTPAMQQTVRALRDAGLRCKIMVGGAVITEEFASHIGADYYVKDAMASVNAARAVYG